MVLCFCNLYESSRSFFCLLALILIIMCRSFLSLSAALLSLCFMGLCTLQAQSLSSPTPASAGTSTLNGTTHLSFTVGEAGTGTLSQTPLTLTAGFQQADPSGQPLPFIHFYLSGSHEGLQAIIHTRIETDLSTQTWTLERSEDGELFEERKTVQAPTANSHIWHDLTEPSQHLLYYRLKVLDADGHIHLSPTLSLNKNLTSSRFSLYPNPARDQAFLHYVMEENVQVKLLDIKGRSIWTKPLQAGQGVFPIPIHDLSEGSYLLQVLHPQNLKTFPLLIRH